MRCSGSENFCSQISYVTTTTASGNLLNKVNDFILWCTKIRKIALSSDLCILKRKSKLLRREVMSGPEDGRGMQFKGST